MQTASRFVRVISTTFRRLLPERVCRNICYRRGESEQIYTYLCAFVGDSAPLFKKGGENKKKTKKCWHFYRFREFARPVVALLSSRLMLLSSGRARELAQLRTAENCFWAGDSRQSTHTIQDSSLSSIFISECLWVCLSVELFFVYYFCFGGKMDFVHSWLELVFLTQFYWFYEVFLWNDE